MSRYSSLSRTKLEKLLSASEKLLCASGENESQHLLQDLQLHKIELEIQNRDLIETQQELESVRDQYAELYDFAPVGYLTLDHDGVIRNLNLTAAAMFGKERSGLIDKPLGILMAPGMSRMLFDHLRQAFSSERKVSCDFTLKAKYEKSPRYVRSESTVHIGLDGDQYCLMILMDISERRRTEQAVLEERTFLQHVIDGIDDPITVISLDYRVLRVNNAAMHIAQVQNLDHDNICCYQLAHQREQPCSGDDHPCPLQMVLQTRMPCKVIHKHISEAGVKRKYELSVNPLFNEQGEITCVIETLHDITEHLDLLDELKERELSYAHLAHHDILTGLPNRLLFADRLCQAIHVSHRNQTKLGVLFIDLDRFKEVNDSFDHACGDELLKAVADRFRAVFREDDTIARMGGDEFTVILTRIKHESNAALVARKLLDTFKHPFIVQSHQIFMGASIGVSIYPDHGETVEELVRNADTAMYRAKEEGRNTFQYYSEELTVKAFERVFLASSLHKAVEDKELILHYQPQIDLLSGAMCGVEALVRWQHSELGLVSPSRFIPLAEESGIIEKMGDWILKEACLQLKLWQDTNLLETSTTISINLSGKQFDHSYLVEEVEQVLHEVQLSPLCLELEITETTMMRSTENSSHTLSQLRELGVKVAVDDFGTGYSSLNYLKRLPITRLKIDKAFVSDIPTDINDMAISKAIISMAKNLSLDVLAEGIETTEQHQFLINQGCRAGQGFLFAHPMTIPDFESFVLERKMKHSG
jgi:diguanylate cyclase (GGDEF)-like protein/PAS domain S-box-containing protein